jgi:hypothetical protein
MRKRKMACHPERSEGPVQFPCDEALQAICIDPSARKERGTQDDIAVDDIAVKSLVRHILDVRGDPPLVPEDVRHRADAIAVGLIGGFVHRLRARRQRRPVHIIHIRHI